MQDDGGTANGGVDTDPTPRIITVNVTWVNGAPVGTDNTVTTLQNTAYNFTAADFGFTDPTEVIANSFQAVKITTLPNAGTLTDNGVTVGAGQFISVSDINSARLAFTPAVNATGAPYGSFTFQVQDNGGTANGGVDTDTTARTMTLNVKSSTWVNHAPVGTANTVTTLENTGYTFSAANFGFTDPNDSPPNNFLAIQIAALPSSGTLSDNGVAVTAGNFVSVSHLNAGLLVYTPPTNSSGTAFSSFTFKVRDDGGTNNGGVDTDTTARTMTVNVTKNNQAPVGTSKTVTTLENISYTFSAADFGFTDPNDSPPNNFNAVKITELPIFGTLKDNGVAVGVGTFVSIADINAGKLVFAPEANISGAPYDDFLFQVQDDGGTANGGVNLDPILKTMTVNVTWVNQAPSGANNTVTALINNAYTFQAVDFGFSDPNDTPGNWIKAVKITTLPSVGTLKDNGVAVAAGTFISLADLFAGNLVFAPAANASGSPYSSFTFQVQDDGGTANSGIDTDPTPKTMTINVTGQWASSVLGYSSQFSSTDWAATQALGAPDTFSYGDIPTAWAPLSMNGTLEYITLGYTTPVYAKGVTIRETNGNGFVYQVDLLDAGNVLHTIWTGTDPSQPGTPVEFTLTFTATSYLVHGVKIYVNTDHDQSTWEEIDAVKLQGDTTGGGGGSAPQGGAAPSGPGTVHVVSTAQVNAPSPWATFAVVGTGHLGAPVTFQFSNQHTASGASAPASAFHYSFDFNNDGNFTDAGDIADGASASATHTFTTRGWHVIRGRIKDQLGRYTDFWTKVFIN